MELRTIKITSIQPPADNPRRSFNKDSLEGLADSIKTDGLLQNLVVAPTKGKKFRIISGERRFRALQLLINNGDITEDHEVPVEVRKNLSKKEKLRLATVENVQRENLHPMDEAEAFAQLAQKGKSLTDLAAETGLAEKTIKRRLALANLCDEAKQFLRDDKITLAMAEVLTIGTPDGQREALEAIETAYHPLTPEAIRNRFLRGKPSVSMAKFPLDQYTGTLTSDLFAEDNTTYFDDDEQFFALQKQAIAEMVENYEKQGVAFIEVTEGYSIPKFHYRDANEDETGGVIINMTPAGEIEVIENQVQHDLDADTAEETADTPAVPAKEKPFYSTPVRSYMAHQKSIAAQAELLGHPSLCTILSIIFKLGNNSAHECLKNITKLDSKPLGYQIISDAADKYLELMPEPSYCDKSEASWYKLKYGCFDKVAVYEALLKFSDEQLDQFDALLTVMHFGQLFCNQLDTDEQSLFNRIAIDMKVDMLDHWTPDAAFLKRLGKDQLIDIAINSGASTQYGAMSSLKKFEIVTNLERYFAQAKQAENPTEGELKAASWLPEAMQFPAIDPQQQEQEEEDSLPETA